MKLKNRWLFVVLCSALLGGSTLGRLDLGHAAPAPEKKIEEVQVSVNTGTAGELETVRGIGPLLAQRIVDYRQANGRFEQLEDLIQVPGIGQAKLERIKSQLTL